MSSNTKMAIANNPSKTGKRSKGLFFGFFILPIIGEGR